MPTNAEYARLINEVSEIGIYVYSNNIGLKHNKSPESAIAQIKGKEYSESLEKYSGDILLVGITYDDDKKHYCKIERITKP